MIRFLAAVGTPIALVAVLAAHDNPVLYLYYLALVVLFIAAGGYGAAHHFRGERDAACEEARRAGEERDAAEVEARIANELLARYKADARVVVPLRSVPTQREPWPPIARAVEAEATPIHDDTAVDLFMRSVERWGTEAEQ
jgi:hypothetical protein